MDIKKQNRIILVLITVLITIVLVIIGNILFFSKKMWFRELLMFMFLWILIENIKRDISKMREYTIILNKNMNMMKAMKYAMINIFNKRTINNLIYPEDVISNEKDE